MGTTSNKNFLAPCDRKINGHRLTVKVGRCGYYYWCIRPNKSDVSFCFNKLSVATEFAKRYANCHNGMFWYRLWTKNPLFHHEQCQSLLGELSYMM